MTGKPLPKHEWLKIVVEAGQQLGFSKFTIFINEEESAVMLRGHSESSDEKYDRVLHRVHKHKNDGEGMAAINNRRFRLRHWMGQYEHWLSWVFLKQRGV